MPIFDLNPLQTGFTARMALRIALIGVALITPVTVPFSMTAARQESVLAWSSRPVEGADPAVQVVTRTLSFASAAGLVPGDTLLTIDGQPATAARVTELRNRVVRGDTLQLVIRRDGAAIPIVIPFPGRSVLFAGYIWFRILLAFVAFTVGLALLLFRGGRSDALALGSALLLIAPISFPGWQAGGGPVMGVLQAVWQLLAAAYRLLFPALLLHFVILNSETPRALRSRWTWIVLYGVLLAIVVPSTNGLRNLVAWAGPGAAQEIRTFVGLVFEIVTIFAVLGLRRSGAARSGPVRWVLYSILLLFLLGLPSSLALLITGELHPSTDPLRQIKWLVLLLFTAATALFLFVTEQGKPVPWRSRQSLTSQAAAILTGLYGFAIAGAAAIVLSATNARLGGIEFILFAVIFLAAILFSPVLRWANEMVDRRMFARWLELESAARAFMQRLATELEPNEIARRVARELPSIFGLTSVELVISSEVGARYDSGAFSGVEQRSPAELASECRSSRAQRESIAVPIQNPGAELIGLLRTGPSDDGREIEPPVERVLLIVAGGIASALCTAEAYLALRDAQHELAESERIAAMGALAGGLAHDIKNPLAGLKMGLYLLERAGVAPDRLGRIKKDLQRIDDLVSGLLRFTRDEVTDSPSLMDLRELVRESTEDLRPLAYDRGITLEESYPDEPMITLGSRDQFRLVVVNLLTNALEALGEGGIIRVSMRGTSDSAELVIHDSGPGIPDDSRHRVFDLNYSTKVGGTGLGLALARRETERVGGAISAESPPGRGTILRVVLPRIIV